MDNLQNIKLSKSLEENIAIIKEIFQKDDTLILRRFNNQYNPNINYCLFFINGMVDNTIISDSILKPIIHMTDGENIDSIDYIHNQIIISNEVKKSQDPSTIMHSIISGDTALFMDGSNQVLIIDSKGWETRAVEEPDIERVIRGPKEGFNECLKTNLTLIRRKINSNELKFQYKTIGSTSQTKACICYIEGVVDDSLLDEINMRVDNIKIDGVLDVKYIQELIDDRPYSIFEVSGITEKPDVVASKLLEGRIAILVDGTPSVMTVPYLFIENFQSAEDYYTNYYFASVGRIVRIIAFFLTTGIPPIYLSLVTYHKQAIPTSLLLTIFAARKGIPFPSIFALVVLLLVFEILIEAGARMPTIIGQTLSIVGALVLGTSAVEAKLVSPTMIIVVAITSITGLIIPALSGSFIVIRVLFILFSGVFGLYGYVFGMSGLLIHLFTLKSYNMPYMSTITSINKLNIKDTYIRAPKWYTERIKFGKKR